MTLVNYKNKMEGVVKATEAILYLFVLLIFLISQQGFYALLHPEEANEMKMNYKGISYTE